MNAVPQRQTTFVLFRAAPSVPLGFAVGDPPIGCDAKKKLTQVTQATLSQWAEVKKDREQQRIYVHPGKPVSQRIDRCGS